ncbi:MAG: hypothetical protein HRT61_00230 [Ekhidna sp.]|nr:hypothetical protein [Ekhidna sp.]
MAYTEKDVDIAIAKLTERIGAPIIRHFDGFIILAQSERDFEGKRNRIMRGDVFGFYTVERAKNIN